MTILDWIPILLLVATFVAVALFHHFNPPAKGIKEKATVREDSPAGKRWTTAFQIFNCKFSGTGDPILDQLITLALEDVRKDTGMPPNHSLACLIAATDTKDPREKRAVRVTMQKLAQALVAAGW